MAKIYAPSHPTPSAIFHSTLKGMNFRMTQRLAGLAFVLLFAVFLPTESYAGCYVTTPTLSASEGCVVASGVPTAASGTVEYMWAENINGYIYGRTGWTTDSDPSFCPEFSGKYRMCTRKVGCSTIYETSDVVVNKGAFPVEWLSFEVTMEGPDARLNWATATELNTSHFEIERSADQVSFEKIGGVEAAGNSEEVQNYTFDDRTVAQIGNEKVYYRLRQVDLDGAYSYSTIVELTMEYGAVEISVYPNPTASDLNITWSRPETIVSIRIVNNIGQVMYEHTPGQVQLTHQLNVATWTSGVYFINIHNGRKTETKRFVKK